MATSVLTIDIESEEFEAFLKEFQSYQQAVDAMPDEFKAMGKKMNEVFSSGATNVKKIGDEAKKQVKNVGLFEKAWDRVSKKTKDIEKSVKSVSKGITTMIPGLGMAGLMAGGLLGLPAALFGLFTASQNWASNGRTQNMALGTSQGHREAFLNQFSTYGIGEGNLATMEEEKTDYRKAGQLALATGLNQSQARDMDTSELVVRAMERIKQDQLQGNMAAARLRSEAAGFSPAQFQNIMSRSVQELQADFGQFRDRSKALEVSDTSQRKAQDFMRTMSDIGANLKTSFFHITESLQGPITKLAFKVEQFFQALNDSGKLKDWIKTVGDKLEQFGRYLVSDEFKTDIKAALADVKEFGSAVMDVGRGIYTAMDKMGLIDHDKDLTPDQKTAKDTDVSRGGWTGMAAGAVTGAAIGSAGLGVGAIPGAVVGAGIGFFGGRAWGNKVFHMTNDIPGPDRVQTGSVIPMNAPSGFGPINRDSVALAGTDEFTAGRITGTTGMLTRSFGIESHGDPNQVSPKGARGYLQWMPDTAKQYGVQVGNLESEKAGWLKYYRHLMGMFHDARAAAAAYNWGEGNVQKTQKAYGADWLAHTPAETQKYVSVVVNNRTGSDIATALTGNSYMPMF
jgi:DNA-binding ferritin-like protein (Dps family)